jgi:hypothetical protein
MKAAARTDEGDITPMLNRIDGMSRVLAAGSRVILLLTAAVVLVMPFTEYLWHFDQFLRGGQDFELSLLFIATILCLVMVMLQQDKRSVRLSLSTRKWLSFAFSRKDHSAPGSLMGLIAAPHAIAVPSPSLDRYNPPLQV